MGIFGEDLTQEEKDYKRLIKVIKGSTLHYEIVNHLVSYVSDIRDKKRNNDFFDFEFLEAVILELVNSEFEGYDYFLATFNHIRESIRFFLPQGIKTPDYEALKRMFINNFSSSEGFIAKEIFDEKFYTLFDSRLDYLYLMNLIANDAYLTQNYDYILKYACEVSRFCISQSVLKNEILSFINAMQNEVDNLDLYIEERLTEAKKRVGIYPGLDEKTLALISAEAEKAQAAIVKLEAIYKKVEAYQDKVRSITNNGSKELRDTVSSGKKEINAYSDSAVAKMKEDIEEAKKEIIEQLDEYLLTLEQALKKSSDQVFNKLLQDAQDKIRDIKVIAEGLSSTTTSELLRIQQATQDSVQKLKNYVETEPQLQEFLKGAQDNEQIMSALKKFSELQTGAFTQAVVSKPASGIIIPGNDRLVVPASPSVIIPKELAESIILPAFDESIPFEVRMDKILEEKKRREANGEFFHEMVEEVVRCILEGDWPYLWGPSGCGKSYVIKQVAQLVGLDLVQNGKITDKYSVMAYNDPHGNFRATQAFVALVYGKMLSLDEFDNGNTDTQVVLNELYSGLLDVLEKPDVPRYVTFAEDMTVPVHPNFRMISAGNTKGEGEDQQFSARGKIDESVQQRFVPKEFKYDNRVEEKIFGDFEQWFKFFKAFRRACDAYAKTQGLDTAPGMATTRDAAAIVKYIRHNSKSIDQIMREKFTQTKNGEYLNFLRRQFCNEYGIQYDSIGRVNVPDNLKGVEEMTLVKSFVKACNNGINRQEKGRQK